VKLREILLPAGGVLYGQVFTIGEIQVQVGSVGQSGVPGLQGGGGVVQTRAHALLVVVVGRGHRPHGL